MSIAFTLFSRVFNILFWDKAGKDGFGELEDGRFLLTKVRPQFLGQAEAYAAFGALAALRRSGRVSVQASAPHSVGLSAKLR